MPLRRGVAIKMGIKVCIALRSLTGKYLGAAQSRERGLTHQVSHQANAFAQ